MPWTGAGVFNRVYSWVADKNAGLDITASRFDSDTNNITTVGLGNCLTRDGQGQPTANLPMAGFRHTGAGSGVGLSDYATLGQLQNNLVNWTIAGGSADALTATYTPAHTALVDGMYCAVRAAAANATPTPTFAPDGLTAHPITKQGGGTLAAGDIAGNLTEIILRYNIANTRWELLNPANTIPAGFVMAFAGAAAPNGWAICDGSSRVRTGIWANLFAAIGTTYGAADGSHFNLPDLRGRVIAQIDSGGSGRITVAGGNFDGTVLGNSGGSENETLTAAQIPAHTHSGTTGGQSADHTHAIPNVGLGTNSISGGGVGALQTAAQESGTTQTGGTSVNHTHPFTTDNGTGGGGSHPNIQPTLLMNYCIKL